MTGNAYVGCTLHLRQFDKTYTVWYAVNNGGNIIPQPLSNDLQKPNVYLGEMNKSR
jgi:hypothetical protein